ncbi:hypothetical protein SESBI_01823 [Sesbania bispinosa]|nr:hypothetical protein SESBI_01823 [Sesbania bispinosa]
MPSSASFLSLYTYHLAQAKLSAIHGLVGPVILFTEATNKELKKNPKERELKNSPMLMVFIPSGHSLRKKSNCPIYIKASPDSTMKNCGTNQNTFSGILAVGSSAKPCECANEYCTAVMGAIYKSYGG